MYIFFLTLLLFFPNGNVVAEGLVTCQEAGTCNFCSLMVMINDIISWIVIIASLFSILVISYAGFLFIFSQGDRAALEQGKQLFFNGIIGIIIMVAGWTIVDTVMKLILDGNFGMWNQIECGAGEFAAGTSVYGIKLENYDVDIVPESSTVDTYGTGNGYGNTISQIGTGNTAIVAFADQMKAKGCIYNQSLRDGCQSNPGYTDCSDLVNVAYRAAGCQSPGTYTGNMIGKAEPIGDPSDLRPGDALIHRTGGAGHVVICRDNGCSAVIHAAGTGKNIINSNGSYYYTQSRYQVIRASNFCP